MIKLNDFLLNYWNEKYKLTENQQEKLVARCYIDAHQSIADFWKNKDINKKNYIDAFQSINDYWNKKYKLAKSSQERLVTKSYIDAYRTFLVNMGL